MRHYESEPLFACVRRRVHVGLLDDGMYDGNDRVWFPLEYVLLSLNSCRTDRSWLQVAVERRQENVLGFERSGWSLERTSEKTELSEGFRCDKKRHCE